MEIINEELRHLLHSDVPSQIAKLEESSLQLERAAMFCEASYYQSHNKDEAFIETKKLTLQSLASVAYYVNSLSVALLRSFDLEADNLHAKANEVKKINQLVAIQRETMARREIGKLAINKSITRQNKITYPTVEEKTPRYQRTPIDYSLLDGVGHGRQTPLAQQPDYARSLPLNRNGSMTSTDYASGNYGTGIYDHYASRTQTLTRNSMRSVIDQYRVPQVIPSALALENNQYIQFQEEAYRHLSNPASELNYSTTDCAINNTMIGRTLQENNSQLHLLSGAGNDLQYRLSNDSLIDCLPLPPSLSIPHADDPLPPPPPVLENNSGLVSGNVNQTNWSPSNYIEKARVVYAYTATRVDELTLIENAIVYILKKNKDGWFEGVLDGVTGMFPGNYVESI